MSGSFKTEAIVLRSIRYGEADRILHLYTADRGRVGAIAKGVRRAKSRLGGRLEPLSRVRPGAAPGPRRALHGQPGRHRRTPTPRLRERRASLERGRAGLRGGPAAVRLDASPNPPGLQPALQRARAARRAARSAAGRAQALAFRLKLLLAAGFAPELAVVRLLRRGASTWAASRRAPAAWSAPAARRARSRSARRRTRFLVAGARPPAGRGAGGARAGAARRPTARSPRRSSTTRTCG